MHFSLIMLINIVSVSSEHVFIMCSCCIIHQLKLTSDYIVKVCMTFCG